MPLQSPPPGRPLSVFSERRRQSEPDFNKQKSLADGIWIVERQPRCVGSTAGGQRGQGSSNAQGPHCLHLKGHVTSWEGRPLSSPGPLPPAPE